MAAARPEVMEFLLTRRSRPAKTLRAPAPDRVALTPILTAAARTPDHGKLEPWRFVVLRPAALTRIGALVRRHAAARGMTAEDRDKAAGVFEASPLAVAVIASPKPSAKIPEIEQLYSAGAVCLALLNAALASGWGANWLSGWPSHDRPLMAEALGLGADERVVGFVHIGTETSPPPERPRPDLTRIVTWMDS